MKAIAINGSPRKNWNTATLLENALKGAESVGAETEMVHLYDLNFRGCTSCFFCKRKDSGFTGQCAMKDGLTEVLEKAMASDVLLFGSPIYIGNITGEMKSFLERLLFMNVSYDSPSRTNFKGKISTGFIYTMGVPHDAVESIGYKYIFESNASLMHRLNGISEYVVSADNYQFDDYSKYAASNFNEKHKAAVKAEKFPEDCRKAFEMGARLCSGHSKI
ncbi:MAG: flavodoxin family protein [Candidatus Methanoplasma sp.]|jgi:multimeric flavodoxin WrbA|nr:flavodoxin family protein [Candidatus Methanoplasma sp.]